MNNHKQQETRSTLVQELESQSFSFNVNDLGSQEDITIGNELIAHNLIKAIRNSFGLRQGKIIGRATLEDTLTSNQFHFRPSEISKSLESYEQVPVISTDEKTNQLVLVINKGKKYKIYWPSDNIWITTKNIGKYALLPSGYEVYPVFPSDLISIKDLFLFVFSAIRNDLTKATLISLTLTLLALSSPLITSHVVGSVVPSGNLSWIISTFIISVLIALYQSSLTWLQSYFLLRINQKLSLRLQVALYDRILSFPIDFVDSYSVGDLSSRASSVNQVVQSLSSTTLSSLISSFSLISFAGLMIYYDQMLSIAAIIFIILSSIVQFFLIKRQIKFQRRLIEGQAELYDSSLQAISAITQVRSTSSEPFVFFQWFKGLMNISALQFRASRMMDYNSIVSGLLSTVGVSIIYGILVFRLINSNSIAEVTLSTSVYIVFSQSFSNFSQRAGELVNLFNELLGTTLIQWQRALPLIRQAGEQGLEVGKERLKLKGEIEFQNVDFCYPGSTVNVLRNLSFRIVPGKFNAIFGPSGCGKSTLLSLILGFYHPTNGSIFVDGIEIRDLDIRNYRSQIGSVLQKPNLPPVSIRDAITSGISVEEELVWNALERVNIDKEIEALPMKLETVLSEGATNISGGQRQRLCIARALLNEPTILLEDEATSALDNFSQEIIINNLRKTGVTRLVVAHRLSAIQECDHMIILNKGRIEYEGTFSECYQSSSYLRNIVESN